MSKTNKGGIKPLPLEIYQITSAKVTDYLQSSVLGFPVGCDFTRWTGISPDHSYVRMRVAIKANDILSRTNSGDYVDTILAKNAAGLTFQDKVIKSLKPYMYPESIVNIRNDHQECERLFQYGLYGERLDEVIANTKLTYCKEADCFKVYLRPERIIADILADPSTNKIDGKMAITAVKGITSETIRWIVEVSQTDTFTGGEISIDKIFNP